MMICAKKTGAAMALALMLPFGVAQAADEITADTVLATVGGAEITVGHMILARETLPQQYLQLPDDVLFNGILDQLIQQNALAQSLPADLEGTVQKGLDNQISGYLAGQALASVTQDATSDAALRAAYDEQFANAERGTEYNASHILVPTEEEAAAVKAQADEGADFAELARTNSTGPSGPNGGALGWFGDGMMVPAFEAAVKELEVGEVSGPVQTQFGWHIVKLNETRVQDAPAFEQVRDQLAQQLTEAAVGEAVTRITDAADVTRIELDISPDILRDRSLLDN